MSKLANYDEKESLGKGGFGEAFRCVCKQDRRQYVLKKIVITRDSLRKSAETEASLLCDLRHENIVLYKECFTHGSNTLCIVMEYCDGGDLAAEIHHARNTAAGGQFSEPQIVDWTLQICLALEYIHERNVIHRDLKPDNIFLTQENIIKIGDFGIARKLEIGESAMTFAGTPLYMSPEIIGKIPYDCKTDIWSLGCCVYELMTLFCYINQAKFAVSGMREGGPMPTNYSDELTTLTRSMLTLEFEDRPTAKKLLQSDILQSQRASGVRPQRPIREEPQNRNVRGRDDVIANSISLTVDIGCKRTTLVVRKNSSVKEVYEMVAREHDLQDDDFYLYSSGEWLDDRRPLSDYTDGQSAVLSHMSTVTFVRRNRGGCDP